MILASGRLPRHQAVWRGAGKGTSLEDFLERTVD